MKIMKAILKKNQGRLLVTLASSIVLCGASAYGSLVQINTTSGSVTPGLLSGDGSDAGSLVASIPSVSYTFGSSGGDTGSLATYVYSGDTYNSTLGGLTYVYVLTITTGDLSAIQLTGNWGSTVAVGYGSLGSTPSFAYYPGGTVDFTLSANSGTFYLVVGTASLQWEASSATLIDSGDSTPYKIYAPVPEAPTAMAGMLLLLPLGASTLRILRKSRMA
jgi:hypothetical protein